MVNVLYWLWFRIIDSSDDWFSPNTLLYFVSFLDHILYLVFWGTGNVVEPWSWMPVGKWYSLQIGFREHGIHIRSLGGTVQNPCRQKAYCELLVVNDC